MSARDTVKVTYSLPERLVEGVRSVVSEGAAPSYSAFVEKALEEALEREREARLARELAEAAEDPLFLADVAEVTRDFEHADAELERGGE
jgi:Arc/MetJ-type ribon-helix-helix transcriptional regulator